MAAVLVDPGIAFESVSVRESSPAVEDLESYRRELTAYCYRMLASGSEAEDAVQETLIRAWKAADRFEGRSSVRSWLYRIATNVCLDMHRSSQRRARPMELGPSSPPDERFLGPLTSEATWVSPVADDRISADPADIVGGRDSIRLAFITALQHLPARQRAVLILCEVLKWRAGEVAELLDTTVAAVNSGLQRARASLAELPAGGRPAALDVDQAELLTRYVDAFERYDMDSLVNLLHRDAVMSMPPFQMWLQGARDIVTWMVQPGPSACRGSKLIATRANGCPAFAQYRPDHDNGGHNAWGLQVLEVSGGRIVGYNVFLDVERMFPAFGLPARLPA
jgi:RNA polymerase sigma-70 factor (ECF subfamily)